MRVFLGVAPAGEDVEDSLLAMRARALEGVDVAYVAGGGEGVASEAAMAQARRIPVLVLPGLGGAAEGEQVRDYMAGELIAGRALAGRPGMAWAG